MVRVLGRYLGRSDAHGVIAIRDPCRESPEVESFVVLLMIETSIAEHVATQQMK
jgi:hypothetical protein